MLFKNADNCDNWSAFTFISSMWLVAQNRSASATACPGVAKWKLAGWNYPHLEKLALYWKRSLTELAKCMQVRLVSAIMVSMYCLNLCYTTSDNNYYSVLSITFLMWISRTWASMGSGSIIHYCNELQITNQQFLKSADILPCPEFNTDRLRNNNKILVTMSWGRNFFDFVG